MITWWKLSLLAIVQGIAEFLPISSSGHLVVLEHWLEMSTDLSDLNIVLHTGTLLAILVVYRQRILQMVFSDRRLLGLVFVGTIPAVVVGLGVKLYFEHWLESSLIAGFALPLTGLMLLWCNRVTEGDQVSNQLSWKNAFGIGLAQAVAILPGISRSGSTIAAGLASGLSRAEAAAFSFLLAIPALAGATVLEILSVLKDGNSLVTPWEMLLVGALLAAVTGWFSLHWLLRILQQGSLKWLGVWCLFLGAVVILQEIL